MMYASGMPELSHVLPAAVLFLLLVPLGHFREFFTATNRSLALLWLSCSLAPSSLQSYIAEEEEEEGRRRWFRRRSLCLSAFGGGCYAASVWVAFAPSFLPSSLPPALFAHRQCCLSTLYSSARRTLSLSADTTEEREREPNRIGRGSRSPLSWALFRAGIQTTRGVHFEFPGKLGTRTGL